MAPCFERCYFKMILFDQGICTCLQRRSFDACELLYEILEIISRGNIKQKTFERSLSAALLSGDFVFLKPIIITTGIGLQRRNRNTDVWIKTRLNRNESSIKFGFERCFRSNFLPCRQFLPVITSFRSQQDRFSTCDRIDHVILKTRFK